ncbi:hypothetical protein [Lacipirellula parvula]|nr:hypothetical protein [Lacipirellula parvula]
MFTADQRLQIDSGAGDADGDHLIAFGRQANLWPDEGLFSVAVGPAANLQVVARGLRKWADLLEHYATAIAELNGSANLSLRSRRDGTLESFDASREVYEQLHA